MILALMCGLSVSCAIALVRDFLNCSIFNRWGKYFFQVRGLVMDKNLHLFWPSVS